jgi:hypothetical protein
MELFVVFFTVLAATSLASLSYIIYNLGINLNKIDKLLDNIHGLIEKQVSE